MVPDQKKPTRILIVEDLPSDAMLARREVAKLVDPVEFHLVETESDFRKALKSFIPHLIISDYQMPAFDGLSALKIALQETPTTPFIIHTGSQNEDTAVACMKAGATDYVLKERIKRLGPAVKQALENKKIRLESLRAQEALIESENRFRRLAENANDIIYRYEVYPEHKFTYVSPSAERMTGYSPEEHYADPDLVAKLIHPEDRPILKKLDKTPNDQPYTLTLRLVKKNGELIWTEQKNVPIIDAQGQLIAIEGIVRDVTERKKAEEDLQYALRLAEESDRLKTAFLNNLSHEIRTPLNSILGFSNLLNEDKISPEQRAHFVQVINQGGQRLLHIINDILSIAAIESGQETSREEAFRLETLTDHIRQVFQETLNSKPIKLRILDELPQEKARILTDGNKLMQIMGNLVTNAIKFTEDGEVTFRISREQDTLYLEVSDTGIGIPKEYHDLIFERFRQIDSEDVKLHEGSGLGLSISMAYARMLGGSIEVESTPGIGSSFKVNIPFKQIQHETAAAEPDQVKQQKSSKSRKKTILVAEDEYSNFLLVETLLEPLPYQVIHVTNGQEAVEQCRKNHAIDLVLMDLKMPLMGGLEATRIIRHEKPNLKIIALTAYAQKEDREKALLAGCNDYIAKPMRNQDLLDMIKAHL